MMTQVIGFAGLAVAVGLLGALFGLVLRDLWKPRK